MKWHECPLLLPGDLVCTGPQKLTWKNWMTWLILQVGRWISGGKTHISHVCRMVDGHTLVEAVWPKVRYTNLWRKYAEPGRYEVAIFRRIDLTDEDRKILNREAEKHVKKRYAMLLLPPQLIDAVLTVGWRQVSGRDDEVFAARWVAWKLTGERWEHIAMYCSWEEAESMDDTGKPFTSAPWWAISPDGIWDEVLPDPAWRPVFYTDGLEDAIHEGG